MDEGKISLRREETDPRRAFRAKRGDVKLAILDLLAKSGPSTGYRIMQLIKEKSNGVWRVSSGSVYPTLERMVLERLIEEHYRDGASVYRVGQVGLSLITRKSADLERIWNFDTTDDLGELEPLEEELAKLSEAIKVAAKTDEAVALLIQQDVIELRKKIFGYLAE